MPFALLTGRLVYYAHVPKCGGSSVEAYMTERFGPLGLVDTRFLDRAEAARWSRTSPQHVDWATLTTFLPEAMIDACFAVVRHPVARVISAYRFQRDQEGTLAPDTVFSKALPGMLERAGSDPWAFDGHLRPQTDFMPADAAIFHLEHGLDALVPYFDALAGNREGPRAIGHENTAKAGKGASERITPDADDLARIAAFYAADFDRFGYTPDAKAPTAPPPQISAEYIRDRDRARARARHPATVLARKFRRRIARMTRA